MFDATLDDGGKGALGMCSATGHSRDLMVNEAVMGASRVRVIKSQNIIIYLVIIARKIRHVDIKKNRKSKFVTFPKQGRSNERFKRTMENQYATDTEALCFYFD
jgi:hypothetical protein